MCLKVINICVEEKRSKLGWYRKGKYHIMKTEVKLHTLTFKVGGDEYSLLQLIYSWGLLTE
jgi:hypothetical protein